MKVYCTDKIAMALTSGGWYSRESNSGMNCPSGSDRGEQLCGKAGLDGRVPGGGDSLPD